MSEEILRALMELFALIVKQDGGTMKGERDYVLSFLRKQLSKDTVSEYLALFDEHTGPVREIAEEKEPTPPTVRDSVKVLGICKQINRTLNQEQKVIVLVRLYELVNADRRFTPQRMNIINTVAEVFKISADEFAATSQFVRNTKPEELENSAIMVLQPGTDHCELCKRLVSGYQDTVIAFLRVASVDLYFMKYYSPEHLFLNGLPITQGQVYSFAKGASLRSTHGHSIYYTDINAGYLADNIIHKLSFRVENLCFNFVEGHPAVDNVSFSASEGKLVGILGASGSGKTTLLNLLCGNQKPSSGSVRINGLDVNKQNKALEGVMGYVPQDDLLIEDLTVFENLYYAARQCFKNKSKTEISKLVDTTLTNLGLFEKRDLKVGSPLNKVISGGQRKRLNIALELIREPSVLFLDEPTSGLSSRDSENLMDLLRDLTLKGKLIITVIHQPSSEVFKMFDKVVILDQGGCLAYYGNPVDSVIWFKTLDAQINSDQGECPACGTVNTETIFNIIETHVVDEFGKYTEKRKVKPAEWASIFRQKGIADTNPEVKDAPHKNLETPDAFTQFKIYLARDLRSKLANRQYTWLTLLEAPILGFILSFIIKYIPDPESDIYIFSENENIPIYIFMSVIVSLFLGLTISAEEIFRDRKILKREQFLNLSRGSYLISKVAILIIISAIQTTLFLAIANPLLGIKGLFFNYWIALFATSFCANMIGLNISASFNSAVTIYIVIPLLIIPMMVLSGAMFPFDKLNRKIGSVGKVPVIAELMPTRWTYEALMVSQFKDNKYSQTVFTRDGATWYDLMKVTSESDFNTVQRIPELRKAVQKSLLDVRSIPASSVNDNDMKVRLAGRESESLELLSNELSLISSTYKLPPFGYLNSLNTDDFDVSVADSIMAYLNRADDIFRERANNASDQNDSFYNLNSALLDEIKQNHYNYKLEEIVTKYYERKKFLIYKNSIVQNIDPVYLDPVKKDFPGFSTHFFAPSKNIFGISTDTLVFNISIVLASTIFLYLMLYFDLLAKAVRMVERFQIRKEFFRGRIILIFLIFVIINA